MKGLLVGAVVAACTSNTPRGSTLAAIDALHRRDIAATLASDPAQLAASWTDDAC
jgi:hypothetical protein